VTTVGVLGGGQLGRMLALAAAPLGIDVVVVEPGLDPPAAVAAEVIQAPYGDASALAVLAQRCDVVTVELEGVPIEALAWLEDRVPVRPSVAAVAAAQDRLAEKELFAAAGIPTAPWAPGRVTFEGGTIVKARRGGYDGRSQEQAGPGHDLAALLPGLDGGEVISEGVVEFERELSIIAARGVHGETACYPLVENHHTRGILVRTLAPAPGCSAALQAAAEGIAGHFLDATGYIGVVAVELFQTGDDLLANEVAPRVHNSGHWTIEGAVTSQFEQHLRAITGLPLGATNPVGVSAMVNLIGEGVAGAVEVLAVPGAHLHRYGKAPRPGRKVGHVTVVANDDEELAARLAVVERVLS
jgi:5-(carboxyamino)imidazole ribonucleotide synthase